MSDDIPIPGLVKQFLSHDPAWCCIHLGFGLAFLFQSQMAVMLSHDVDVDEARRHFMDMVSRTQASILAQDRDGLVKVMLEAYSDDMRSEAIDLLAEDDFKAFVDNIRNEVKALKKANGD